MQQKTLNDKLHLLDFDTDSPVSGLLFVDRKYKDDKNVSFDEILTLDHAEKLGATAVYFRRIEGRGSIPQLFIFDNSGNRFSSDDLSKIHIKLWSSGIVPLYYIFNNTEVKIFDCRKPVDKKTLNAKEFDKLKFEFEDELFVVADIHAKYKKYSAMLFQNGSFWELQENKNHFNLNNSSYKNLIEGLKKIRDEFVKGQNEKVCNKLLVLSILVKYLEERKDSKDKHVLPAEYFKKYNGATCFCDVLRKNKCIKFFEDLGCDINGKIFKLTEQEKKEIAKLDQPKLAEFLDAKKDKNQFVFWQLYDFNYLPVELISRIYEEFVPDRKDITYTPSHLTSFMVDECMPITVPQKDFKLIDVSCGSGIFLVTAFKRMVQWWQYEEYKKDGQIKTPKIGRLKTILKNSIYGVDLEREAARLTIFSLTVALCDMLDPTIMWDELTKEKLIDLSDDNIIAQDFFDFVQTDKKFNLVIGNPPFNLPEETKEEKDKYWDNLARKIEFDFEIPQKKIALLFLQQAMKLLKKGGLLSLVMPSGALLYNETLTYRRELMERYNVPQIFDFSCLRAVLFEKNVSASVIFVQNVPPDNKDILHIVVRRTISAKEKLYFEIDKYDLYYVTKELAKTEQLIWKTNLLGGGYLFHLVKRMQSKNLKTLEEYLKDRKKHGWFYGGGYEGLQDATEKPKKAPYLTGKEMISSDKFVSDEINEYDIEIEHATLFHRIKEKDQMIFKAPHILIKTHIDLPLLLLQDTDLIFNKDIIGIHVPNKLELIQLGTNIRKNRLLYKALIMLKSGRIGIGRETSIRNKDILDLPYPCNGDKLKLSKAEQIVCDDVLEYGIDQLSRGEEAKANTKEATKQDIAAFAKVFCVSLNSIYKEGSKQFYPLEHIESLSFICQPFAYGNSDKPKNISESMKKKIKTGDLSSLINNPQGKNVLYRRIIKLYPQKDMVYLIKPKILRYWLKSIALRDANDVFTDLVSSGY